MYDGPSVVKGYQTEAHISISHVGFLSKWTWLKVNAVYLSALGPRTPLDQGGHFVKLTVGPAYGLGMQRKERLCTR